MELKYLNYDNLNVKEELFKIKHAQEAEIILYPNNKVCLFILGMLFANGVKIKILNEKDLNLEINQKRRTLERMLRDINEDIADVKSTNKNANIESLEQTKANIRANLDRLDAINAERVLNRQSVNY